MGRVYMYVCMYSQASYTYIAAIVYTHIMPSSTSYEPTLFANVACIVFSLQSHHQHWLSTIAKQSVSGPQKTLHTYHTFQLTRSTPEETARSLWCEGRPPPSCNMQRGATCKVQHATRNVHDDTIMYIVLGRKGARTKQSAKTIGWFRLQNTEERGVERREVQEYVQ